MEPNATPAALGYRMPAEWEPHEATWFSWPHNPETWPGAERLAATEATLAQAVRALALGEAVHINVLDAAHEAHVRGLVGSAHPFPVHYHHVRTNDAWCRDHGAIFVVRDGPKPARAATNWSFNAWGGKYPPFDADNAVPEHMARILDVLCFDSDLILEGGSIEVNGRGALLTTRSCLLNPNRNPDHAQASIETALRDMLGVSDIYWLDGDLAGDDTDSHIDNLVRFVGLDTLVVATESNPADVNYEPLHALHETAQALRQPDGQPFTVYPLPMPDPVYSDGIRLPTSYANFYIGNRAVLLPAYGCPQDAEAQKLLANLFPNRLIVPLDCTSVVYGLGAFHCLTQQVPAVPSPTATI